MPAIPATPAAPLHRTYEVRTYGCQMNVHDSERLSGLLEGGAPRGERRPRAWRRAGPLHVPVAARRTLEPP